MLWRNRRSSGNVVDRRGMGGGTMGVGTLVVGAIIYTLMGGNPLEFLAYNAGNVGPQQQQQVNPADNDTKQFVSVVLADTEDVWNQIFKANGITYKEPKLVLFTNQVQSACGRATASVGPFYCPGDNQVYLDLGFFKKLDRQLGAGGDFAQAYVVAHEVGHHVQTLLGVKAKSVPFELQADCLAGVWAYQTQRAKSVLEEGDTEEALNAASAVGDDTLQKATRGEVVPDSFTHGTSAQRVQAFKTGFSNGDTQKCLDAYTSSSSSSSSQW
jgi:predicted metalloprotease